MENTQTHSLINYIINVTKIEHINLAQNECILRTYDKHNLIYMTFTKYKHIAYTY